MTTSSTRHIPRYSKTIITIAFLTMSRSLGFKKLRIRHEAQDNGRIHDQPNFRLTTPWQFSHRIRSCVHQINFAPAQLVCTIVPTDKY
jgi:hypothetical protein